MQTATQRSELLDLRGAAERLGVSRVWVNVMVLQGRLAAERLGNQWVIRRDDLESFADNYRPRRSMDLLGVAYPAFAMVGERAGITVEETATCLGVPRRTALDWLQSLDKKGLVERCRGSNPREPARCYLTEAGQDIYREEMASQATRDNP